MNVATVALLVLVLVSLLFVHYDVRLLRTQMNRLTASPSDEERGRAMSIMGDVDQPPDKKA